MQNTIDSLKNKHIFLDFDGTLVEYRYNGHVSGNTVDPNGKRLGGQSLNEVLFGNCFYTARPLETMKEVLKDADYNKVYILGAFITYNEVKQKIKWLSEHYPLIKEENMFFVADLDLKPDVLKEFSKEKNVSLSDMVFIDDSHAHIRKTEEAGILSYHITSFMK